MNIFKQRAEEYLGKSFKDNLSRTDKRRLLAKAKKIKNSERKAERKKICPVWVVS
jgi:hypothetical protein